MDVETVAEKLFFCTAYITGSNDEEAWTGTGFMYGLPIAGKPGQAQYLVTNKHVVEDATLLEIRMIRATPDGKPMYGTPTTIGLRKFSEAFWLGHPDPKIDVAVVPIGQGVQSTTEQGGGPYYAQFTPDKMLTKAGLAEFDALEEVVLIGYPSGLFDSRNLIPVARRGLTATPIRLDYEGEPAFLIDAAVFEGSSGSPVVAYGRGGYSTRGGGMVVGTERLVLLGILASGPSRKRVGDVIKLQKKDEELVAVFDELLSLGKVYKAWTIDECVDAALAREGFTRGALPQTQ